MVSFFTVGPYSNIRVELEALSPTGPYRLEVDHPAKRIVEYFNTPFEALVRHAEIEAALSGHAVPSKIMGGAFHVVLGPSKCGD